MNRRARPRGRGWSGLLSAAWLSAAAAAAAPPWPEGEAELAFGYDSNPAQSADGPGLAFVRLAFDAARAWPRGEAELSVGADGWYTDQEGPNDNLRLALHTDWTRSTAGGLGRLTLGATGALYRDDLVPADARNEAAVSLRYARTLGPRDSASATAEVRWLDYIYPSLPWAGRPGSGPANPTVSANAADAAMHTGPEAQGTHSGNPQGGLAVRRTDRLSGLALDATHDWTPRAAVTLSGAFARCDSPTPVNAYARAGLGLLLRTDLAATWPLEVGVGWSRTRYDRAPRQLERVDTELTAGLSLRHSLGPAEAHCGLNWVHSDSTAPGRSFRQQVVRCGLAWCGRA
jgi:hypothetical protein